MSDFSSIRIISLGYYAQVLLQSLQSGYCRYGELEQQAIERRDKAQALCLLDAANRRADGMKPDAIAALVENLRVNRAAIEAAS